MIYVVSAQTEAFGGEFPQISLEEAIEMLKPLPEIPNDTETSGLSCHSKKLLLIQLGNEDFQIDFDIASYGGQIPQPLKDFMNTYDGLWILQNAKFDLQFYYKQGVILKHVYDTMLAEYIITMGYTEFRDGKVRDVRRDLQTLVRKYCNVVLDKSVRGEIIRTGLSARVIEYGANDVKYLIPVKNAQMKVIQAKHLDKAVELDNKFVKVLAYIEYCGIKLDWDKWAAKAEEYRQNVINSEEAINRHLYYDLKRTDCFGSNSLFSDVPQCLINWSSPKQVIPLFESLGINCTYYDHGEEKKSCSEKVLNFQIKDFKILQLYFEYKEATKKFSTYGYSWQKMINKDTGRIHTSFMQIMATGRLSCGDMDNDQPNLQNLPNDKYTRSCFIAEPGNKYIACDYSSQESIVLANFANDESLISFYRKGLTDMHSFVAFLLYPELQEELHKTADELTENDLIWIKKNHKDLRQIAKTAEFAIAYGGDGSTIAKNTGSSKAQGIEVYNAYFTAFSGMKQYFDRVINRTLKYGYIEYNPYTKRKYFLMPSNPVIKYAEKLHYGELYGWEAIEYNEAKAELQRLSQNYPIQGSSADCSKLAGILFFNEIIKRGWFNKVKIVNMIHDEYNVEAPEEITEEVAKCLKDCMVKAGTVFCKIVPLGADVEIGDYWVH